MNFSSKKPATKICSSPGITQNVTMVIVIPIDTYKHFIVKIEMNDGRTCCVSAYSIACVKVNGTLRRFIKHQLSRYIRFILNPKGPREHIISRPWCNKYSRMMVITVPGIRDYRVEAQDEVGAVYCECVRGVSVEGDWSVCSSSYPLLCSCLYHWKI